MKTPRDILFARHSDIAPKLDAIRREAVAAEVNRRRQPGREFTFAAALAQAITRPFQEIILPCRRLWTGLAVVWLLLFIINFSQRDGSRTAVTSSAPVAMMSFREQQKLLNELFADRSLPAEAEPPRVFSPKPRTEIFEARCV
jgi:hypothetical protein